MISLICTWSDPTWVQWVLLNLRISGEKKEGNRKKLDKRSSYKLAKANGCPATLDKKYMVLLNYSYLYKII